MESQSSSFIIIGAGPAGLITGIELKKLGHQVIILERMRTIPRQVCGEYLSPEGVCKLEELNLKECISDTSPVRGMILVSPNQTEVETFFPDCKWGQALNREHFLLKLSQIFLQMGGQIYFGETIKTLSIEDKHVFIKTQNKNFKAEWLIGADGRKSSVAKLLKMEVINPNNKRVALHCYLKPKFALPQSGQMHILPDGSYIGINPINEHEVNFSIVTNQNSIHEMSGAKELINYWIKTRPSLRKYFHPIEFEEIRSTAPITRLSGALVHERCVLIGDASGFIDPLTGEGITTAIKTAMILTQEIAKSPQDMRSSFYRYEIRRKNDFVAKEKLNWKFQKLIQMPFYCDLIANLLNLSKFIRNTFIGIIGNIYTPKEGLKAIFSHFIKERGQNV